jgi:glucose-6-phosphate isomerase
MTDIRSLEQTLLDNLLQNKARIKFVARFLLALVSLRQNGVGTGFVMADAILPKGHFSSAEQSAPSPRSPSTRHSRGEQ